MIRTVLLLIEGEGRFFYSFHEEGALLQTSALIITSVKRVHGVARLTLSDGETLSMPRAMLKERPYRSGMSFDRESFRLFLAERAFPFAMDKAVALLSLRARTERELVDTLRRNAYPEETIARVMARLVEAGYIDDAGFSAQWAASRASKGMGSMRIRMELRRKGVCADTIDETLSSLDGDAQMEGAIKMAQKAARGRDLSNPAERQKVLASLARRGYDFFTARRALDAVMQGEE